MNAEQREAVRENAKYLREVRPIDPDEIYEYVDGQPHPAAVRQVLRESAADLGLVERGDGAFEPPDEAPVTVDFDGTVDALPARHAERVAELLVETYGPDWHRGESGDRLRERVREIKDRYLRGNDVRYDELTALGYATYHLPTTYAEGTYVLAALAAADRLPGHLRVLDVGAGVGGPALALLDLLSDDVLVEYDAIEPSAAADVFEHVVEPGRNAHVTVHRSRAEAFEPDDDYDLLLFANVLSELDDPAETLSRYLDALAETGTAALIAPADRNTAIGLRRVERAVADDGPATVYAPTVRLWPGLAPASDSWSFDVRPDVAVPSVQERLDGAGAGDGEFVNVDVQYAHSLLGLDGEAAVAARGDRSRYAPMAEAEDHVADRVNLLAVKLSRDLADGDRPLYLIGDGSQRVDHFAVLTEESALNAALRRADYGAPLSIENALVLWNDDEGAYNVVVDGETVVDPAR